VRGRVMEKMNEPKLSVSCALSAKFALVVSTEEDVCVRLLRLTSEIGGSCSKESVSNHVAVLESLKSPGHSSRDVA
jgi:hypothetical protein